MYCPHCGTENAESNRFCVNCGSALSRESRSTASSIPLKERLARVVGTTRKTRLVTAATVLALIVAVIALMSLDTNDEGSAQDPYLKGLDRACVGEKKRISALEQKTLGRQPSNLTDFASVLVTILAEWRVALRNDPAPAAHAADVEALEVQLREALIEAGALARLIKDGRPQQAIAAQASAVDQATEGVDSAISALGLRRCRLVTVQPGASS